METMTVRQSSGDDRIDGLERKVDLLAQKIDDGFRHIDRRFNEIDKRFEQVDKRFEQVDKRFEGIETGLRDLRAEMVGRFEHNDDRFYAFQRTMFVFHGAIIAALLGIIATQV